MEELVGNLSHKVEQQTLNEPEEKEVSNEDSVKEVSKDNSVQESSKDDSSIRPLKELEFWNRGNVSHVWKKNSFFREKCSVCNRLLIFEDILHCPRCDFKIHHGCQKELKKECSPILKNLWVLGNNEGDMKNTPLIAFVNRKSGGHQGASILKALSNLLGPHQVFDLTNGGPSIGLQQYYKTANLRILVAGGDGSVGWVLSELDELGINPPILILPLGTGNDLSRSLKWGPGYSNEPLIPILKKMEKCKIVPLDRWSILVIEGETQKNLKMNNYFSLGIDAAICLGFHEKRESSPQLFSGQVMNKMWYGLVGTSHVFSSEASLSEFVHLEIDGEVISLDKSVTGIIVLNLSSYAGGTDLWNVKHPTKKWNKASFSDGMLEVVGAKGAFNAGTIATGMGNALKIGQGRGILLRMSKPVPMQIDGEPWRQEPCEVKISIYNCANFIFNE